MKIRTDFVTNSSSSSYCVSLIVKTAANKKLELDFWPEDEDGSGEVMVPLKEDVDSVVNGIKACESVEELRDLLLNALDLNGLFGEIEDVILDEYEDEADDMDNTQFLAAVSKIVKNDEDGEFEDYEDVLSDVKKTASKFKRAMDKIEDLSGIKSVSVCEYFTGWGEFARDGVDDFLAKAVTEDVDQEDADAVRADLEGKLDEDAIESIVDQIENDSICQFSADITTTVLMADGKVEKKYSFEAEG